ncbi:MAG: hypothetical protein AAF389_13330 [Gemmatimonadota bacterium]
MSETTRSLRVLSCGFAILFVLSVAATEAAAQDVSTSEDIAALKREVSAQLQRIALLEQLVHDLTDASEVGLAPLTGTAWQTLTLGMSETAVVSILGQPDSVVSGLARRTLVYTHVRDGVEHVGRVTVDEEDDMVRSIDRPVPVAGR